MNFQELATSHLQARAERNGYIFSHILTKTKASGTLINR